MTFFRCWITIFFVRKIECKKNVICHITSLIKRMRRVIAAPLKYVQGPGEIKHVIEYAKIFGKNGAFAIVSPSMFEKYGKILTDSFGDFTIQLMKFNRECCEKEINRLTEEIKKTNLDVVIGIGGGKALDTAKVVAHMTNHPIIVVPTIASTDAPCSALAIIYTEDGVYERSLHLPKNPEVVIVDSEIIAKAPVRLLVAGMGDALATYYEARSCASTNSAVSAGGHGSISGLALAKACRDTLFEDGLQAKLSCEMKLPSIALEKIIEVNTYLSGIGFESGGVAGAHAIQYGLTELEETHKYYHGEKVSFGLIAMMILEDDPLEEINEVIRFCKSVGLPTTLAQIGVTDPTPDKILKVAANSMTENKTIHTMHVFLTPERIAAAIYAADKLGQ